jgi:hypothetical protein
MAKRVPPRRAARPAKPARKTKVVAEKPPAARKKKPRPPEAAVAPATPVKKPRRKKPPPRIRARWGVFDAQMRQVAIFDYNQRAEADRKVAELAAKKQAEFFLQVVKEPLTETPPE